MSPFDRELVRALVGALRDDPELLAELRALLDPVDAAQPEWLTISEAASYLRVSERTIERRIESGRLPTSTLGRRVIVSRGDLDALLGGGGGGKVRTNPPRRRSGRV
jgi:excisionase family DNA binding protein